MATSVIFLLGPTASGKTDLAMHWAERYPIEIISVDSAMIYRGMDIGTAKPSLAEQARVPHHLIDICDPAERYSVAQFCQQVQQLIPEILARERIPVLVGGTMLYYRALLYGLSELPAADPVIRAELLRRAQQEGWASLHASLEAIDPVSYAKISPNDTQRIQRALEVYQQTGRPISADWAQADIQFEWPFRLCGLMPASREALHAKIALRFQQMLEQGFVEEVEHLFQLGDLDLSLPAMRCVGYRQVWQMLQGECTYTEMSDRAVAATRQLAKRQLTWLRHWPTDIHWVSEDAPDLGVFTF